MLLDGVDLLSLYEEEMRQVRLAKIALVAQGAMNSLNPVLRVQEQIRDGLKTTAYGCHRGRLTTGSPSCSTASVCGAKWPNMFPHELSGGMKQRVCIAIAISLRPKLIIADEPTSALDVVVQRQVMETLLAVQEELGASIILIGHDMGLMAQVVDRVGVMYAGNLAEVSPVGDLFREPLHPYTQLLIASLPSLEQKGVFQGIPGCRRRCSTGRPAARSVRAARMPWSAAPVETAAARGAAGALGGLPSVRRGVESRERMTALLEARTRHARSSAAACFAKTPGRSRSTTSRCGSTTSRRRSRRSSARAAAARRRWRACCSGWPRRPAARCSTAAQNLRKLSSRSARDVPARRAGDLPGSVRGLQPVLQGRPRPGDADQEVQAGANARRRRGS